MLILDRFEGEFAVVETDNGLINIPRIDIPAETREGDVLVLSLNKSGTVARKESIESRMNKLFMD